MLDHLWRRWRQRREAQALQRRAIPDALWQQTLTALPFLAARSEADLAQLRRLSSLFLDSKEFSGAGGLTVTDAMALSIAAQACLPVLRFGLAPYADFVGIVVHPDEVLAHREVTDEHGVVHQYDEPLAGEAVAGGPIMLSWSDVAAAGDGDGTLTPYNVVIHEFAHVLDLGDGVADGIPPLPGGAPARQAWRQVIERCHRQFRRAIEAGRDTLLDPYGAQSVDEFFAVAAEAFFVSPLALRAELPSMYRLLAGYYRQDPAGAWG